MQFNAIPGHDVIKKRLIQSVQEQRISHAQLFLGPEGCGHLAMAVAYMQYIACTQPSEWDSCGTCPSCQKFAKLAHPDVLFSFPIFKGSSAKANTAFDFLPSFRQLLSTHPFMGYWDWIQAIEVENKQLYIYKNDAHEIVKSLHKKSFESEYKFMLMWLPEKMNIDAANVLLKTMEEPADKTLIVLVSSDVSELLPTIISRTQRTHFHALPEAEAAAYMATHWAVKPDRAAAIARLSEGNLSLAKQILGEQEQHQEGYLAFRNWMADCLTLNISKILETTEWFAKLGRENQKQFLSASIHYLRNVLLLNFDEQLAKVSDDEKAFLQKFKSVMVPDKIEPVFALLQEAMNQIERNANPKILFTDLSLQLHPYLKMS